MSHGGVFIPEYLFPSFAENAYLILSEQGYIISGCNYMALDCVDIPSKKLPQRCSYAPIIEAGESHRNNLRTLLDSSFNKLVVLETKYPDNFTNMFKTKVLSYDVATSTTAIMPCKYLDEDYLVAHQNYLRELRRA